MAALSDFIEAAILNHFFRNTDVGVPPANVYIALSTAATTDAGGTTEPVGNGYVRKTVSTTGSFGAPGAAGSISNLAELAFAAAAGGTWGTITHVAIMDAATAGNMLYHGALAASRTVNDGDVFRFAIGALTLSLA